MLQPQTRTIRWQTLWGEILIITGTDDQILMQLGGYGNFEGEHKQEFNNGLRQILSDARTNKIKDFDTLAKSIIDYRASFRKDPYKVLPLGDVKL